MAAIDALWHVLNFFEPALAVGIVSAGGVKLLWRRELGGVSWLRLAAVSTAAGAMGMAADLLLSGHDGRIAAYALMLAASALSLVLALAFAGRHRRPQ